MQPISKSEEFLYNLTQNLESDHNVLTDHHGNNNDNDRTFWDRILEYDKTHQLANSEDVLFNSTPNFECDRLNNKNDGSDNISFWDKILEEGKSECVSFQPISESEDFLYNPSLNFESDHRVFDHYQGDNNGGGELCWNEDWEHGKVECVSTQPISKSEDIWANTTLNF
ncbi:hypothetical protein Pyn_01575 [Prunus yedoensis var. nudiflora]|uniref:Uncharacterized protein n=1 Tax=Prunus yedoensis var. nudiflora TaxID=2094558 RepID=A0A315A060_PRUYE|nr:hypothetical protein Pyn_01575 [Prunus yedoensis var. nudiflora]